MTYRAVLLVSALGLAVPADGRAHCGHGHGEIVGTLVWPPYGTEVPTNAVFFVEINCSDDQPVLATWAGDAVDARVTTIDTQQAAGYVITPTAPLTSGECYRVVRVPPLVEWKSTDPQRWCVGREPDTVAPSVQSLRALEHYWFEATVSEPVRYVVRGEGRSETAVWTTPPGFKVWVGPASPGIHSISVDRRYATVVAIDAAGNTSKAIALFPEDFKAAQAVPNATVDRSLPLLGAVLGGSALLIGVAVWRRRRRASAR